MSTFQGKVAEIPGISIDRFDGENFDSLVFFLSHCHTDHMIGLENQHFQQKLIQTDRKIYLSHISAAIMKNTYPSISNNLVELDFHSDSLVRVGDKTIAVTPIPAGHCPGSVMLLFEGDETVLYTGDYRINPKDVPKFRAFYDSYGNRKRVDAVYLDTTFFLKSYAKFPSRAESLEEICSIIREWICRSEKHVVGLSTSAKYGYEYLFIEIYKQFKMPVHVNDECYKFYARVPEVDEAVTRVKTRTKIHCACGTTYSVICPDTVNYKIKNIKVSAFRWRSDNLRNGISENNQNTHFVCYSTHASYEEGAELLKFLKPKKVEPNVLHKQSEVNAEIYKNIEETIEKEGEPKMKKVKLFEVQHQARETCEESQSDPVNLSILDSPPRKYAPP